MVLKAVTYQTFWTENFIGWEIQAWVKIRFQFKMFYDFQTQRLVVKQTMTEKKPKSGVDGFVETVHECLTAVQLSTVVSFSHEGDYL